MKDKIERFYDEIFEHTSECWIQSNESGKCICKKEKFLYLLKEVAGEQRKACADQTYCDNYGYRIATKKMIEDTPLVTDKIK